MKERQTVHEQVFQSLFYCCFLCRLLHSGQILALISRFKQFKLVWFFFFVSTLEQFLAPLQANTRSVRLRARFGSCHLSTAQRTLSQVQISCCRTRSGSGHVCIVSVHGCMEARKHTLKWNLVRQMWCERIIYRHTDESNQATSSCFSSESVLIINDYFTALERQCCCTSLTVSGNIMILI